MNRVRIRITDVAPKTVDLVQLVHVCITICTFFYRRRRHNVFHIHLLDILCETIMVVAGELEAFRAAKQRMADKAKRRRGGSVAVQHVHAACRATRRRPRITRSAANCDSAQKLACSAAAMRAPHLPSRASTASSSWAWGGRRPSDASGRRHLPPHDVARC